MTPRQNQGPLGHIKVLDLFWIRSGRTYADRPGVDQIAQGMGGLMSITGPPGEHTQAVLREYGYSEQKIRELEEAGVIAPKLKAEVPS